MNEIITFGGVNYTAINVITGINTISFSPLGLTEQEAKTVFKDAKALVIGDGTEIYGEYPNVTFESITIEANERITVNMHILTETEVQLRDLQVSQLEQDEVITELLYGGNEI